MLCWLVSWSSVILGGKCLWNFRFIWCHSPVFQSTASWVFQHAEGLKIAESTSPDERCLKGGYQDWGTQSKHLTHMHTQALGVFGSDKNWQWFVCNDWYCVCNPQLLGSRLYKPAPVQHPPPTTWAKRSSWITKRVLSLSKSRHRGQRAVGNKHAGPQNVATAYCRRWTPWKSCKKSMIPAKNIF